MDIGNILIAVFSPQNLLLMNIGLFIGIIFGAIPGLTGNLGIIVSLPLTFSLTPITAMTFLLGIAWGGGFGGSITAILVGTPGTAGAAATVLDGYPLAKKGHAKKAIQMALTASCIGGLISAISLLLFSPLIAKVALLFGPPEYFMLAVFGISIIGAVSGKSILKGIIIGCFGFLLGMVGLDNITGIMRFTFNSMYLFNGFEFISILLGVFALSQVLVQVYDYYHNKNNSTNIINRTLQKDDNLSIKELRASGKTIFKSSLIGSAIGAIPAAGPVIATFMSYNEAKTKSKHPENFGKGELEGIAAPEAANNAITGAALIPMLTLGIPGSGIAATLMGALAIQGMSPGPMLFSEHGFEVYVIMCSLIFINIFMYIQGRTLSKYFALVTKVPTKIITIALMILCTAGAFSLRKATFDLYVLVFAGIIMFYLIRLGFPSVPIVLGLLLGKLAEDNLRSSLVMSNGSWDIFVTRPMSIFFILLTVFMLFGVIKQKRNEKLHST
ncbi:MAG: tripartite tricarboxylate transporter permease [Sphaerochaetaceae bacterium]|nr:tripartite tricarboxylate transporter permease [Sphaerochaetaceae bacterium]MDC7242673.1 tripartite tricarboxylate transporter permease [Sphaerochaetaceae bacterium]